MTTLETAILNFMLKASRQNSSSSISLEVISAIHGIDLGKLKQYVAVLEDKSLAQRERNGYGPKKIIYDIRIPDNDPKSPKGSEHLYIIDRKGLDNLITEIKSS